MRDEMLEHRLARWSRSGFPLRHRQTADRRDETGDEWIKVRGVAVNAMRESRIVALVGPRGTGKTQMAASICRELVIGDGWTSMYYRTADLLGRFKQQVFGEGVDEFKFMDRLARVRGLVLDEFQDRYESETEDTIIRRLLDHRYGAMVGTLIIANLTADELGSALGASVWDRMREAGIVIPCKWESYRGVQK